MDESIKIYTPMKRAVEPVAPKKNHLKESKPKGRFFADWKLWGEILSSKDKKRHELEQKYPWFDILYNWILVLCIFMLFVSFGVWGVQIRTNHVAEAFAATALADYQAEQEAAAQVEWQQKEAARLSEQAVMGRMATEASKAVYGIRNFISKYGYSNDDIRTYVRCMCDRVDYFIKTQLSAEEQDILTLEQREMIFMAIVKQEGQFLAYSEKNPPLNEYYKPSFDEVNTWLHEESKPWDITYRFAELNDDGIWLVQNINSDGYARRVRY